MPTCVVKAAAQGGKAGVANLMCALTQSGHRFGVGHFSLNDPKTDNRSHGTSAVPEGYLVSHLANERRKKRFALLGRRNAATATSYGCLLL